MSELAPPNLAQNRARGRLLFSLAFGLLAVLLVSLLIGRYPTAGLVTWEQLSGDDLVQRIVLDLRLPRLLAALLLGMALSAAGMVFQLLFRNPLVEPGFWGFRKGRRRRLPGPWGRDVHLPEPLSGIPVDGKSHVAEYERE